MAKFLINEIGVRRSTPTSQAKSNAPSGQEYNLGNDFTAFERTVAASTETIKNQLQTKLNSLVLNKHVSIRGSKGYGQPIKDFAINVKSVSIDFYYDRYVVIFKDEKDKEYFLEPGYKIRILGPAVIKPPTKKAPKPKLPVAPPQPPRQPYE
jgi:hypothetical protein